MSYLLSLPRTCSQFPGFNFDFIFSFIDSRKRGRKERRERNINVREKHGSVASCPCPDWGPNRNQGMWLDRESNLQPFCLQNHATPARASLLLFKSLLPPVPVGRSSRRCDRSSCQPPSTRASPPPTTPSVFKRTKRPWCPAGAQPQPSMATRAAPGATESPSWQHRPCAHEIQSLTHSQGPCPWRTLLRNELFVEQGAQVLVVSLVPVAF